MVVRNCIWAKLFAILHIKKEGFRYKKKTVPLVRVNGF